MVTTIKKVDFSLDNINSYNKGKITKIDNINSNDDYELINYVEQSELQNFFRDILIRFIYTANHLDPMLCEFNIKIIKTAFNIENITSSDTYDKIVSTKEGYTYYYNNEKLKMIKDNKNNVFRINEDNSITCITHGDNTLDIYCDSNNSFGTYGGNQLTFANFEKFLLARKDINDVIDKYYPNTSYEDKFYLLNCIANCGCGYVAIANAIFQKYEGKEKEFQEKFGFDLYKIDADAHVTYNYEVLVLDLILNYYRNDGNYTMEELYGYTRTSPFITAFTKLFHEKPVIKGIDSEMIKIDEIVKQVNENYNLNLLVKIDSLISDSPLLVVNEVNLQQALHEGYSIIIGACGYDLYDYETGKLAIEDGMDHAMTVTGFDLDGRPIVSSWGRKYILDVSNIDVNNDILSIAYIK